MQIQKKQEPQRLDLVLKILKPLLANKFGGWVGLFFIFSFVVLLFGINLVSQSLRW